MKFHHQFWILILFGLIASGVWWTSQIETIPLDPPAGYQGQLFDAVCPVCLTIYNESWEGRKCFECNEFLDRIMEGDEDE